MPGFVDWLRAVAPTKTNNELHEEIRLATGYTLSHAAIASLRRQYHAGQSAESRARAIAECHSDPAPQRLRLLGPEDKEFFVTVTGDCLVTSDWHIPYHDQGLVDRMLLVAKTLGVKQLVINGDFLNQDAFSKWKGHAFQMDWRTEKAIARATIRQLCETFKTIYYIMDNHDRRIMWMHEKPSEFSEDDVLDLITDAISRRHIRASIYYHYVIINATWRVTSPKEYRRTKLSLPNRLAQVYGSHIISGGDHLFGMGMDDSGRYIIANNCCIVNAAETPYINVQDTTYPKWNPGFYAILDNVLHPFIAHEHLWPTWWQRLSKRR